ncbi:FAD-dependent oxidoreductase [Stenotrophomonas sp. MMGLT7]|uniref:FAD-dependent oxidoreductase n=1 Tax=Stenotrophomonas sp. MMGLT7 TaxID=2901227 RepID=UPI001E4CC471|nr:FAD-dependent oxidoreductase [Stenotrophomonas sp. MMGLT7]MCD7097879.1 FAD-dependent oxidoreductase [Stenotrophomonas sp. MMGLT7]
MQRRNFLRAVGGAGVAALSAGATGHALAQAVPAGTLPIGQKPKFVETPPLAKVRASPERVISVDVCTRPFRAQGPRIEAEKAGRKTIIHSYGHGGSGWSLSWGTGEQVAALALATGEKEIAVVGCGAIGLTAARVMQRYGLKVHIYAREFPPVVRSSYATGAWTPASRIVSADHATPEFRAWWQKTARSSFRMYQSLLGLPGNPIAWQDVYLLSDGPAAETHWESQGEPDYPDLQMDLIEGFHARSVELAPDQHPFAAARVRRGLNLVFGIGAYSKMLMDDFVRAGGSTELREFGGIGDIGKLRQKVIVNATGYGARALLGDDSVIPVRGQTCRLAPQPEVNYNLYYTSQNVSMTSRTDGLLVQSQGPHDFGNEDARPDYAEILRSVEALAKAFA